MLTKILISELDYVELCHDLENLPDEQAEKLKNELAQLSRSCDEILRREPFETTFRSIIYSDEAELKQALNDAQRLTKKLLEH